MDAGSPPLVLDAALRPARPLLWLAAVLAVVAALSARDLWGPDEPRYGLVARGMAESGDWLVPRLSGRPYAEKPPLVFWAMAASGVLGRGLTAVLARLPCALLAGAAVLLTARLARRWFGDERLADTAALLFATTGLVLWNAPRAALDLPMTAFALLALDAGTTVVARASLPAALGFGAALGLGVLAKGPHALYLPLAALAGGCAAARRPRRLLDPRWLAGLAVAAAVVLAWVLPALARAGAEVTYRGTETYSERLLGQIGSRLSGESEPHRSGPLNLVVVMAVMGLPWSPVWVPALVRALRPSRALPEQRFGLGACAAGLLVPLVLLSLPATKREVYAIPLFVPASIVGAWGLHHAPLAGPLRFASRAVAAVGVLLALAVFGAPFVEHALPLLPWTGLDAVTAHVLATGSVPFALGAAGAAAGAGALGAFLLRDRPVGAVRSAGVGVAAAWIVFSTAVLPAFDPWNSLAAAAEAGERAAPGAPLAIAGFSDPSVLWNFRRPTVTRLGDAAYGATAETLAPDAPRALVLVRGKFWREKGWRTPPDGLPILDRAVVVWQRLEGGTPYLLLTNAPPPAGQGERR